MWSTSNLPNDSQREANRMKISNLMIGLAIFSGIIATIIAIIIGFNSTGYAQLSFSDNGTYDQFSSISNTSGQMFNQMQNASIEQDNVFLSASRAAGTTLLFAGQSVGFFTSLVNGVGNMLKIPTPIIGIFIVIVGLLFTFAIISAFQRWEV